MVWVFIPTNYKEIGLYPVCPAKSYPANHNTLSKAPYQPPWPEVETEEPLRLNTDRNNIKITNSIESDPIDR